MAADLGLVSHRAFKRYYGKGVELMDVEHLGPIAEGALNLVTHH